jgi:DNA-binding GntR family transcriptional regulator
MSLDSPADNAMRQVESFQGSDRWTTDTARVFERLRSDILSLGRKPGTALDEEALARAFRTSKSRVRDALVRLASDGHVVILPNQSTIVAPLDLQGIPGFMDALELMQRSTHRLAAMLRTDSDLARIRRCDQTFDAATAAGDVAAMIAANYDLHMAIAEAGRNPYFTELYSRLLNDAKRLLHMHYALETEQKDRPPAVTVAHHGPLVAAIAAGDPDMAEKQASRHSLKFRQRFLHLLDRCDVIDFDVQWVGASLKPGRRSPRRKASG